MKRPFWQMALALLGFSAAIRCERSAAAEKSPTFNRDLAPIIFGHCVPCHHPGGSGPFSLTTFRDVKKRADLIGRVTASGYMPPWLPEAGHGDFVGTRTLSEPEIAVIAAWIKAGLPEGRSSELKVRPKWNDDWQLGKPDLIVTMPEAYTLPPEGRDVYRNFVIPGKTTEDHYVRAMEFRPGNRQAVHHAFIFFDPSGSTRSLQGRDGAPGFVGMNPGRGAASPEGMFTSWQPGKGPSEAIEGAAAPLRKGSDIVLQLHLRPTGKPEKIQSSLALYFTKEPPVRFPFRLLLRSTAFDIPPGATDYAIEAAYTLPVDVEALAVQPHLHYRGREVHGWATLPDGTKRELISIKRWNFDWQGDYRYATPVSLPKGSTLRMRYTYDNSAANPRNPVQPPVRVSYGLQTSDEMGELWLLLLPKNPAERARLVQDYADHWALADSISCAQAVLRGDPTDTATREDLGAALAAVGRVDEATAELRQALADDPKRAHAHYILGVIALSRNHAAEAGKELETAVKLDPADSDAQNNLGWLQFLQGDAAGAVSHLEAAVKLNPDDALARTNLEKARAAAHHP